MESPDESPACVGSAHVLIGPGHFAAAAFGLGRSETDRRSTDRSATPKEK
jgi:hypothetical protein